MKKKQNTRWLKGVATVGGVGLLPLAPGTWGAAVGVLLLLPFTNAEQGHLLALLLMLLCGLLTWCGAKVAHALADEWGEDPKAFVFDELVGVWVALIGHTLTWGNLLLGFVLFRIFDIAKPFGIRKFERYGQGWGVMLDDVAAGVAANFALILLQLIISWYP
jgi:phosphatidylglycerophosphatase A